MKARTETAWRVGFNRWTSVIELVQEANGRNTVLVNRFPAPVHTSRDAEGREQIELFLFGQRAALLAVNGRWQLNVDGDVTVKRITTGDGDRPVAQHRTGGLARMVLHWCGDRYLLAA